MPGRSRASTRGQAGAQPKPGAGHENSPVAEQSGVREGRRPLAWLRRHPVAAGVYVLILLLVLVPALLQTVRSMTTDTTRPPQGLTVIRGKEIVLLDVSETGRVLVTMPEAAYLSALSVSSDGKWLAFVETRASSEAAGWGGDLYVAEVPSEGVPGEPPQLILRHEQPGDTIDSLAWGPGADELLVAYRAAQYEGEEYIGTRTRLEKLSLQTGKRELILEDATDPAWSPGAQRIAYVSLKDDSRELWTARPDGTEPRPIPESGEFLSVQSPRYSPDGKQLVFAAIRGGLPAPFPFSWDGWLEERLGPRAAHAHGAPWDLWSLRDGTELERITNLAEDLMYPAWSPEGDRIALVTDVSAYIMKPDGGNLRRITSEAEPRGLAWIRIED